MPLAVKFLAASVAAGHGVVALGREWLAAHRAVDLLVPHPATDAGAGVEHAAAAIVAAHALGMVLIQVAVEPQWASNALASVHRP
jgi:hypothetical protein